MSTGPLQTHLVPRPNVVISTPTFQFLADTAAAEPLEPLEIESLEIALDAPLRSVRMGSSGSQSGLIPLEMMSPFIGQVLMDVCRHVQTAWRVVGQLSLEMKHLDAEDVGRADRLRARQLCEAVLAWSSTRYSDRMFRGLSPRITELHVPEDVYGHMKELSRIGQLLRLHYTDVLAQIGHKAPPMSALVKKAREILDATIPPSRACTEWVAHRIASDITGLAGKTLRNKRDQGERWAEGLRGVDGDGRVWGKQGPNSHALYLRSSLAPARKVPTK